MIGLPLMYPEIFSKFDINPPRGIFSLMRGPVLWASWKW
jgi:ATP-dependent 26S proteasome regulatory subunit